MLIFRYTRGEKNESSSLYLYSILHIRDRTSREDSYPAVIIRIERLIGLILWVFIAVECFTSKIRKYIDSFTWFYSEYVIPFP